jgi:hypothetical protein
METAYKKANVGFGRFLIAKRKILSVEGHGSSLQRL